MPTGMRKLRERGALLFEYVAESTTACVVTMAQGNLLAITFGHLVIASQTGLIAGSIASLAVFLSRSMPRWVASLVLGLGTAVVDFLVHPGMFGPIAVEALVTGFVAAALSYFTGTAVSFVRQKLATRSGSALPAKLLSVNTD